MSENSDVVKLIDSKSVTPARRVRQLLEEAIAEHERNVWELSKEKDFFKQRVQQMGGANLQSTTIDVMGTAMLHRASRAESKSPRAPHLGDAYSEALLPGTCSDDVRCLSTPAWPDPSKPITELALDDVFEFTDATAVSQLSDSVSPTFDFHTKMLSRTASDSCFLQGRLSAEEALAKQDALVKKAKYFLMLYGGRKTTVPMFFRLWRWHTQYARTSIQFTPHREWQDWFPDRSIRLSQRKAHVVDVNETANYTRSVTAENEGSVVQHGFGNKCLIYPGSTVRIVWDLMGAVLLAYDIVMIPLSVFGPDKKGFITFMEWFTLIFWSIDMFLSCITGVIEKGQTVMVLSRILMRYLKSWFWLDVVVVVPDWIFLIMELSGASAGGSDQASSARLLRSLRVLRTMRLLRLAKLRRILLMVRDRVDSEMSFVVLQIIKLVMILLLLNHCLAAVWWGIGSLGRDEGIPNWIDSQYFQERQFAYRYLTALHYAFCMFTPGSMNVQPQNVAERSFAVIVLIFGMVIFTSFISSMTTAVGQLKAMQGTKSKDLWMLRRFLRQHGVDKDLKYRVLRYADYAFAAQKAQKMSKTKVNAMQMLSEQLRAELDFEVTYSILNVHPLLAVMRTTCRLVMFQLVGDVLEQQSLAAKDILFTGGARGTHMFIVVEGEVQYQKVHDNGTIDFEVEEVVPNDWLSEHVIWVKKWICLGVASCSFECELISIRADAFIQVICSDARTKELASPYANKVSEILSRTGRSNLCDVSKYWKANMESIEILEEVLRGMGDSDHDPFRAAAMSAYLATSAGRLGPRNAATSIMIRSSSKGVGRQLS